MYVKKQAFVVILLIFNFTLGLSQNRQQQNSFKNTLINTSLEKVESNMVEYYSVDDYTNAYGIAVEMSKDVDHKEISKKGVNLLALLAKNFTKLVITKKVSLDNKKVKVLLEHFESQKYYIERPKVSRSIKLMNYLCKGEYTYVHKKLIETKVYKIFLTILLIYLSVFFLSYSSKFKWKYKKKFRKFALFSFAFVLLMFILFKNTCYNNVKDYSFYGFSI